METRHFDYVVIGGGSAGYAAARTAREKLENVAIIDDAGELGGLCILRGCMPSKTLIYSAEVLHLAREGAKFGLKVTPFSPPSGPIQWIFQWPPVKSKVLTVIEMISFLPSFPSRLPRFMILPLAACLLGIAGMQSTHAATISPGDATIALGPTFFVDDAASGGGDLTVTQPAVASYIRSFAGLLNSGQGLSRVTLTGFGFATSSAAPPSNNTATSLTVTFTYLGANEAVGGGDDVLMGSATGTYAHSATGEYVLTFDTPVTANLNITGTRFQIQVAPSNGTSNGKVLFKTDALTYETSSGPKFSVAGLVSTQRLNLAKFQSVTTDSVSTSVKGQRYASYVTDGVAGNDNRWESDGTAPHWAQVTFPFAVEVGSAQVFSGLNDGGAMTDFKIQYLSGASWLDVPGATVTGNTNFERNLVFSSPVTSTAFRIYNSADATVLIRELALYPPNGPGGHPIGTDLTLNLARQRPALASAKTAGNFALLAVDGRVNKDSKWQTPAMPDTRSEPT